MRHGNQSFSDEAMSSTDRYLDPRQSRFTRRQEGHGLIVRTCEAAEALNELPFELKALLDATPRTIARQRPQLLLLANLYNARCRETTTLNSGPANSKNRCCRSSPSAPIPGTVALPRISDCEAESAGAEVEPSGPDLNDRA